MIDMNRVSTVVVHGTKDTDSGGSNPIRVREYAAEIGAALYEPGTTEHDLEPWLTHGHDDLPRFEELLATKVVGAIGEGRSPAKRQQSPRKVVGGKRGRSGRRGGAGSGRARSAPAKLAKSVSVSDNKKKRK
eukprot:gene5231-7838_t